jgi:hypothetical protein
MLVVFEVLTMFAATTFDTTFVDVSVRTFAAPETFI